MIDVILSVVLVLVIGGAALYLYRAKKNGQKCIGCPESRSCSGNCACCGGCSVPKDGTNQ